MQIIKFAILTIKMNMRNMLDIYGIVMMNVKIP